MEVPIFREKIVERYVQRPPEQVNSPRNSDLTIDINLINNS